MGNIGNELKKSLNKLGVTKQVEAVGVVGLAEKAITEVVPREEFKIISFRNNALKIYVSSSVVASQIQLNLNQIQKKIGQKIRLQFTIDQNKDKELF